MNNLLLLSGLALNGLPLTPGRTGGWLTHMGGEPFGEPPVDVSGSAGASPSNSFTILRRQPKHLVFLQG